MTNVPLRLYRSANAALAAARRKWRSGAPRPGFGRESNPFADSTSSESAPEPANALRRLYREALIGGRWILALAVGVQTVTILLDSRQRPLARAMIAAYLAYMAASLAAVHLMAPRRLPARAILLLDLAFISVMGACSGGQNSPFLGQYYFVIMAGALLYGMAGGLTMALIAAIAVIALDRSTSFVTVLHNAPRAPWPYYLATGAFCGFLTDRLRAVFVHYRRALFREHRRRVAMRVAAREMDLARRIQLSVLPARLPNMPGLDIAVRARPARVVGGDFHVPLSSPNLPGTVGFVVGDVSGKGLPAAFLSTSVAHLLPFLNPLNDPADALTRLNSDLFQRLPDGVYVTLILAAIDIAAGQAHLWNAGHPPALCRHAASGEVVEAQRHDAYLALSADWSGRAETLPFAPGDILLLYSDGFFETRNAARVQFGLPRLMKALQQSGDLCADDIAEAILSRLSAWGTPDDDLTLVVCRRSDGAP